MNDQTFRPMTELPAIGLVTVMYSDGHVRLCEIKDGGGVLVPREGFPPIRWDVHPTGWREPITHGLRAQS